MVIPEKDLAASLILYDQSMNLEIICLYITFNCSKICLIANFLFQIISSSMNFTIIIGVIHSQFYFAEVPNTFPHSKLY